MEQVPTWMRTNADTHHRSQAWQAPKKGRQKFEWHKKYGEFGEWVEDGTREVLGMYGEEEISGAVTGRLSTMV